MRKFFLSLAAFLSAGTSAFAFEGAQVSLWANTPVTVPNSYYSTSYTKIPFPEVNLDTGGFWDATSKQFVVPSSIAPGTYGIISCHVRWQSSGGYRVQVLVSKYDASANAQLHSNYPESVPDNRLFTGGTTTDHASINHPVLLEPGDAYSCQLWQQGNTGASPSLQVLQAGMSLQVLD